LFFFETNWTRGEKGEVAREKGEEREAFTEREGGRRQMKTYIGGFFD
jgi:hypothetical protein